MSIALGWPIGLMVKEDFDWTFPTEICEEILNAIYQGKWDGMKLE